MNRIFEILTVFDNTSEVKVNERKSDAPAFGKIFDKAVNTPRTAAYVKSERNKRGAERAVTDRPYCRGELCSPAVRPIKKQTLITRKMDSDKEVQTDNGEVKSADQAPPENTGELMKPADVTASLTQAEINHKIIQTLSDMLLIPPEQILTALVDLNIQPVMLQEQQVLEEFIAQMEAVLPVGSNADPSGASQPELAQSEASQPETSQPEAAQPEAALSFITPDPRIEVSVTAEQPIKPDAGKPEMPAAHPEVKLSELAAAVKQIVENGAAAETEETDPEDAWAPEPISNNTPAVIPAVNSRETRYESDTEEDIGDSWYSSGDDRDITLSEKPEAPAQPKMDGQAFTVPQTETSAAPVINETAAAPAGGTELRHEAVRNVDTFEIIRQVKDGIQAETLGSGVSEMKLTLKPESLGEVSLRILSDNGIISARFMAENQRVKEIVESNFTALRDSLSEQGVNVSQLSVSVGQRDTQDRRFVYQPRRSPIRAAAFEDIEPDILPLLAAHDSRVSYTA